jgi:hypothetical protein
MAGRTTFSFDIYVGSGETIKMSLCNLGNCEVAIRVKPTLTEGELSYVVENGSGYIGLSSENGTLKLDQWQTITVDISGYADVCTQFAFDLEPGTIYLRNLMFSGTAEPKPEEPEFPPIPVELTAGGNWAVLDEAYAGGWSFGATQVGTKVVTYVPEYNTLTFKITSRWGEELFPKTFKLYVDGKYYEHKEVNGVAGWYNGETLGKNIKTTDYKADEKDYAWLVFEISGITGSSNVHIVSIPENGKVVGGYGKVVTLIVKDMVWTRSEVVEPEECVHDWAEATCEAPKTCKLCGET